MSIQKFSVVSLFAGCGGFDLGIQGGFTFLGKKYQKNPFEVIWANDIDEQACETYAENIGDHIIHGDIWSILDNPGAYRLPEYADVVIGGFPCQPFSTSGKRRGLSDRRGNLYLAMREVIERTQPKIFLAENVQGLLSIDGGSTIERIVEDLSSLGYHVNYHLYHAFDFGVAQNRPRVIIAGTRTDLFDPFIHMDPVTRKKPPTSRDVLQDLEDTPEGGALNHYWSRARKNAGQGNSIISPDRPAPTMRAEHHGNIEYHYSRNRRLSAREAARIQSFPDNFEFLRSTSSAYRQIGNAVAPIFAWHLGRHLKKMLATEMYEKAA